MSSLWQRPADAGTAHVASVPEFVPAAALAVVAFVVVVGLAVGTATRSAHDAPAGTPTARVAAPAVAEAA